MRWNWEVFSHCNCCGCPLHYGNTRVTLNQRVERVNWSEALEGPEIEVLDEENVLVLCLACACYVEGAPLSFGPPSADGSRTSKSHVHQFPDATHPGQVWPPVSFVQGETTRAWMAYPPEAEQYLEYVRGILQLASEPAFTPDRIRNGVIDYAAEREGALSHRGMGVHSHASWIDPCYESVGSCSRQVTEPVIIQDEPWPGRLRRRDLSFVSLARANWTSPGDPESFVAQVLTPLLNLQTARNHLYGWLQVLFADCEGEPVAYFSRYEPSAEILHLAQLYGITLVHRNLEEIPDADRETNRRFHSLHVTRSEWEALLGELGEGKKPPW